MQKKAYTRPTLREYGSVQDITLDMAGVYDDFEMMVPNEMMMMKMA